MKHTYIFKILSFALLISIFQNQIKAQKWQESLLVSASDADKYKNFGISVAIDSNYAVVGAYFEDTDQNGTNSLTNAGAVYIYKIINGQWEELKKIVPTDRTAGDRFGEALSISGDYLIIGAYNQSQNAQGNDTLNKAGAAYIFEKDKGGADNWGEAQKIVNSDRVATDFFGYSVDICGDYAVVGAYYEDEDAQGFNTLAVAGSAYIFGRDAGGNWIEQKKIVASDRFNNDWFGYSVAIHDTTVVVGAVHEEHDQAGANLLTYSGSAYVFYRDNGGINNWGQIKKIVPSDRIAKGHFGAVVDIYEDDIIVGTEQVNTGIAGFAYVFNRNTGGANSWGQVKKILPSNTATNDNFGNSVAISGDYIIIGANFEDHNDSGEHLLNDAGSTYIFSKNESGTNAWGEIQKITASDNEPFAEFGTSVAIYQKNIIIGSDKKMYNTGRAYIFMDSPEITGQPGDLSVCPHTDTVLTITAPSATEFQWQILYSDSIKFIDITGTDFENDSTANLIIKNASPALDSVKIRCVVKNLGVAMVSQEALFIVYESPVVTAITSHVRVCADQEAEVTLSAKGAVTYVWNNDVKNGIPFVPLQTKEYIVIGTDEHSCTASDSVTVFVDEKIIANAGKDTTIMTNTYKLNAENPAPGIGLWITETAGVTIENTSAYNSLVSNLSATNSLEWTVVNGKCSSNAFLVINVKTNSIKEESSEKISVYPNPSENFIIIDFQNKNIESIKITDISGKTIYVEKKPNNYFKINIENFKKTVYVLYIETNKGTIIKKIFKN